ncbi:Fructoselysine-6-P-deglycase FrlB with duplicated sugar isomerase (SIS) domain [Micromonospora viridifaciens]|uniref:Fructoselysine-6-P-deglycase FrlB with duplicated sugar isomerase (SIS) domain n=1 Tax=Micromonospora viridifaciens TaxID=1881 RepID=A0A1C4X0F6_MICVI|nr:sugar isomerase [Micromonospora viridifaciens]SCF01874.1 Fructoselysine-6-P-deglycase FrlB with duplicated sugar isomerase (SIS) domain [Micromonospora viridifaciens]
MTHVEKEIASQPECWQRGVALAGSLAGQLPSRGERVAVVGCGTSWFIAMAYARLRERAGHGETDAFAASEFPGERRYDRVVAISRSGTTTEVLGLLRGVQGSIRSTGILGDPGAPAVALVDDPVCLPFADERSVVQTRFATTTLAVLRAHLGEDLDHVVSEAAEAVAAPLPLDPAALEQVTFLGRDWTVGLAHEAALKCREAASFWTEAYPAMDYRHGPVAIAGPGRAVWAFGAVPTGLADEVTRTGATFVRSARDPLADLILAQRLAVALALHRGLDPDAPRHLTRSVVLA